MKRTLTAAAVVLLGSAGAVGVTGTANAVAATGAAGAAGVGELANSLPASEGLGEATFHVAGAVDAAKTTVGGVVPLEQSPVRSGEHAAQVIEGRSLAASPEASRLLGANPLNLLPAGVTGALPQTRTLPGSSGGVSGLVGQVIIDAVPEFGQMTTQPVDSGSKPASEADSDQAEGTGSEPAEGTEADPEAGGTPMELPEPIGEAAESAPAALPEAGGAPSQRALPTDALLGGGLPTDALTGGGLPTDALTGGGLPTDALLGGGLTGQQPG